MAHLAMFGQLRVAKTARGAFSQPILPVERMAPRLARRSPHGPTTAPLTSQLRPMSENHIPLHRAVHKPQFALIWIALWCAWLGVGNSIAADETPPADRRPADRVSVDSATTRLLDDAADRHFDQHSLLEAALIADGVEDAGVLSDCNDRLRRHRRRLGRLDVVGASPKQRARIVHQFMHAEILTGGYEKHGTSVAGALRRGSFNCVSSSILFRCLCAEIGLSTVAVETSGHVWIRLVGPGPRTNIQTTVVRWQDATQAGPRPLTRRSGSTHRARSTHRVSSGQRPAREIGDLELVAMIFYNRGVDLLHQRKYVAAAELNRTALKLDPQSLAARANLLAALNNRTVQLTEKEQFRAARKVLLEGLSLDGRYAPLLDNDLYLHSHWIASLCRTHRFAEAWGALDVAQRRRADEKFFRKTRLQVCRRWATRLLAEGSLDEALALFDAERHLGADGEALRQIESDVFNDRAVELAEQQRLDEAISLLELAMQRGGARALLTRNHRKVLDMQQQKKKRTPASQARAVTSPSRSEAPK